MRIRTFYKEVGRKIRAYPKMRPASIFNTSESTNETLLVKNAIGSADAKPSPCSFNLSDSSVVLPCLSAYTI